MKTFFKMLKPLLFPEKMTKDIADDTLRETNICDENTQIQIQENTSQDIQIYRQYFFSALRIYAFTLLLTFACAGLVWYLGIIVPSSVLLFIRIVSGFFIFVSVFMKMPDQNYIVSPSPLEALNQKLSKKFYLFGMFLLFFSYITQLFQ